MTEQPIQTPCPELSIAEPSIIVIFGSSGDLTKRKLIPSLYNLAKYGLLSPDTAIVGVARRESSTELFREQLTDAINQFGTQKIDPALWAKFREKIYYCQGDFDNPATYKQLSELLAEVETKHHTKGNALFYLSNLGLDDLGVPLAQQKLLRQVI